MKFKDQLLYHLQVNLVGRAALRFERMRQEYNFVYPNQWNHDYLNPPLSTTPRLKELIGRHYLAGQHAHRARKVAWVTSGAPIEFLKALDFVLIFPENHAALCGIRHLADRQCQEAEKKGYSRDICSYARTDLGTLTNQHTPVGRLPPPDVLVCCNNICQTVLHWFQVLAHHFGKPLILIDTPFLYEEVRDHDIRFVESQIDLAIEQAQRIAAKPISDAKLVRVMQRSYQAVELWMKIMECGRFRPSPLLAFDEFIHLAPIVEMRGARETVDYYRALLSALQKRIARGEGALVKERVRLIWDNLPIWFRMRALSNRLAQLNIALVGSTYSYAWGQLADLINPEKPLVSMARVYLHGFLNRSCKNKLRTMRSMLRDYQADGVVFHSNRSCKPYSFGQIDQQRSLSQELGVPTLSIEADHNDSRAFAEQQLEARLTTFCETLGIKTNAKQGS